MYSSIARLAASEASSEDAINNDLPKPEAGFTYEMVAGLVDKTKTLPEIAKVGTIYLCFIIAAVYYCSSHVSELLFVCLKRCGQRRSQGPSFFCFSLISGVLRFCRKDALHIRGCHAHTPVRTKHVQYVM